MNTIRHIESATLIAIGALCAAAVLSLTANAIPTHHATASSLPTVTIAAKHMSAAEKTAFRAEMNNGHTML